MMIDLTPHVGPGSGVWWSQTTAEPSPLVHALMQQIPEIGPVRAFVGMSLDKTFADAVPDQLSIVSYGGLGELRKLSARGLLDVVPCHYSALPSLFEQKLLPCDVGMIQVSPPDADGYCSLGVGVDYVEDAIPHTPVLIAEINRHMPVTHGAMKLHIGRFAAVLETDRALPEVPDRTPSDIEKAIAANVAGLVSDGDTIQIGVGSLPGAVLAALSDHRDLGLHSGMISDGVVSLVDRGVLTGARKEIDPGILVTGAALGTTALYDRLADLPIEFRPASYTHSPRVLSQLSTLVAINSAIEVDLSGQVGSETRGEEYVGAVGGQVDFCRAASLTGGRSIIALRSTTRGESTIKSALDFGSVTTGRSDVDFVVTEHGVASLRGVGLVERARRLTAIAAPEHRELLEQSTTQSDCPS